MGEADLRGAFLDGARSSRTAPPEKFQGRYNPLICDWENPSGSDEIHLPEGPGHSAAGEIPSASRGPIRDKSIAVDGLCWLEEATRRVSLGPGATSPLCPRLAAAEISCNGRRPPF